MTGTDKLGQAKLIIEQYYSLADYGIFFCRNMVGDPMYTIYEDEDLTIDICYEYSYFEVFGLTVDEEIELEDYYYSLGNKLKGE